MKKVFLIPLLLAFSPLTFSSERTLDERCDGHAKYVVELLKNRYKGETLAEQLELVEEWSDPVYKEEIKGVLREIIYKQPMLFSDKDVALQGLENYTAAYRSCIVKYEKD